ncbi:MAG: VanW family protein, partial [Actinomycetota bacterium]|nr:VanW family protein [Actinomycetota bacterium]
VGAELSPEAVRPWLRSRAGPEGLELTVDEERIVADLPGLLPGLGQAPVDAGLRVEGDGVVVVPSGDGTTCCGPEAPALIREALLDRPPGPVALPLTAKAPERTSEEAAALGVTRPVATFTTRHAAGESRVTNIHRIADLVRGVVIEPGASFSVNGFVGRRTRENGFVEGGVIEDGVFQTSVGGGISQFATTLFNAAFFGGLDFEAYQSHSLYISRYPFGREATLSFPEPDLEVSNPTPYGILVWPTYDASSITVTLWSTPSVSAVQSAQSRVPVGPCTRVNTERTRTWLDGRKEVDEVHATYRPREGVDC